MILLDYSQVALANIFQFQKDLRKDNSNPEAVNIIRHAVLTGVKSFRKKYGRQYGEVVLACDGRNYWRKDIFPYYKAGRKASRDSMNLDWKLVFDTISSIRDDLAEHFPYKVLHFDDIEGDDIIATLALWTQTNGLQDKGIFEEKQPVLIVSSDGDYKQLHRFDNIKQWSPVQNKFVTSSHPRSELLEKIAKGDTGDGIPNVLSDDAVLVTEGVRQKKMMQSRLDEFSSKGREACRTDEERRNWDRNDQLINFEKIPVTIQSRIVDGYINSKPKGDKMSIYNYLVKNRCRLLLNDIEEF